MKSEKEKQKHKKRSVAEATKRRREVMKQGYESTTIELPEGVTSFALKDDKNVRIDILPYEVGKGNPCADKGMLHWERTYYAHRVGPDGRLMVCPSATAGEPCPVCERREKLRQDEDSDDDLIKSLYPKKRQLFNVINLADKDAGVQIWDISYHLFGRLLDSKIENGDEDDNFDAFADFEDGKSLKLAVEEKKQGRMTWLEVVDINLKDRENYDEKEMMEKVQCLDDLIKIPSYEELEKIFLQIEPSEEKSSKKGKSKSSDEDEETLTKEDVEEMNEKQLKKLIKEKDLDVDPDDCDDEEELREAVLEELDLETDEDESKKGRGKKDSKKDDDDDDEEDDDDNDDDDDDDDDEEDDDDNDDDDDDDNDDDDNDDDDEEDDDDDEEPKKKSKEKGKKKGKK